MRYQRDRPVLTHSFPTRRSSDLEGGVRSIGGKYAGWVRLRRRHRRRPATTSDSNANVTAKKAGSACGPNLAIASPASAGPRAAPTPLNSSRLLQPRSEEHTSELQSLMRISYAVFCLKTKNNNPTYRMTSLQQKIH